MRSKSTGHKPRHTGQWCDRQSACCSIGHLLSVYIRQESSRNYTLLVGHNLVSRLEPTSAMSSSGKNEGLYRQCYGNPLCPGIVSVFMLEFQVDPCDVSCMVSLHYYKSVQNDFLHWYRLREIEMSEHDADMYQRMPSKVRR